MIKATISLALLLTCFNVTASNFPRPAALEPAIQFWVKVYTNVSTQQGYIHDDENLAIIYQTLDVAPRGTAREHQIKVGIQQVIGALKALGKGKRDGLSSTEKMVLAAWPADTSSATYTRAAGRVRFQLGQSNRFKEGLVRSGQWKPHIRSVLAQYGLPGELEVLPHVESSFNPSAYSKVAAAGMWQFMPSTARQYMRVDHILDERMDPFIATDGAARLLKTNYRITGTWPLALTSYNHGAAGMRRASKSVGTTDIDVIVKQYKGRAFGFASRNFYASFLAALQIDSNPGRYFGDVTVDAPVAYDVLVAPDYLLATALASAAGISKDTLKQHNPALRNTVWTGEKLIPRGYPVRMPEQQLEQPLEQAVASLSIVERRDSQKPDLMHRIARGDSLSTIAKRYGTTVSRLKSINGMRRSSIRAGKTLILPGSAKQQVLTAEYVAETRARLAGGEPYVYVIRSGDSLWSIAKRFKVSTKQLVVWNDISTEKHLQPGQKLKIASAG